MIVENGHHRGGFWPGSHHPDGPRPWAPGTPVDMWGALAVARGMTSGGAGSNLVMVGPMTKTLHEVLPDRALQRGGIQTWNDGPLWSVRVPGAGWWLRRRAIRTLRAAAARCRALQTSTTSQR